MAAGDADVSAHYFFGKVETTAISSDLGATQLLHFDPHMTLLPALESKDCETQQSKLSLVRSCLGKLRLDQVNASFCVGLIVRNEKEWKEIVKPALVMKENGIDEVIEVLPQNPVKMMGGDCDMPDDF